MDDPIPRGVLPKLALPRRGLRPRRGLLVGFPWTSTPVGGAAMVPLRFSVFIAAAFASGLGLVGFGDLAIPAPAGNLESPSSSPSPDNGTATGKGGGSCEAAAGSVDMEGEGLV